jgi:hypothetical protein
MAKCNRPVEFRSNFALPSAASAKSESGATPTVACACKYSERLDTRRPLWCPFLPAKGGIEGREDRQIARTARGKNDIASFPQPLLKSPDKRDVDSFRCIEAAD